MLTIQNLKVAVAGQEILKGVSLELEQGQIHVLMGPNGSGKSTLTLALAGHPRYDVMGGLITFEGQNLLEMAPEERAKAGLFVSFQTPREVPGVAYSSYLRAIHHAQMGTTAPLHKFKKEAQELLKTVGLPSTFLSRDTHHGFSGGEKKKSEIAQVLLLNPKLAVFDEVDSGLDVDALAKLTQILISQKKPDQSYLFITHNPRLLSLFKPDHIHVMMKGMIVASGGAEIAQQVEEKGYDSFAPSSLNIL